MSSDTVAHAQCVRVASGARTHKLPIRHKTVTLCNVHHPPCPMRVRRGFVCTQRCPQTVNRDTYTHTHTPARHPYTCIKRFAQANTDRRWRRKPTAYHRHPPNRIAIAHTTFIILPIYHSSTVCALCQSVCVVVPSVRK